MNSRAIAVCISLTALHAPLCGSASAQGSLTPPAGPPVASMKTLDQVEARTPLVAEAPGVSISAAGTITISQPGSYYLTKNLVITTNVDGIVINADATVDLNGFGIIGTAAAITTGDAIVIGTSVNATVRNGFIKGGTTLANNVHAPSGFEHGVHAAEPGANVRLVATVQDLTVSGVRSTGIFLRRASRVERCTVQTTGGSGINAATWVRPDTPSQDHRFQSIVSDCSASDCGYSGIVASKVSGSFGHTTSSAMDYTYAPCGILAYHVDNSTGWATGSGAVPGLYYSYGIHGFIVTYSSGKGSVDAIRAQSIAVACASLGGSIFAPQKQLGTP